jgi:hypothetical protein
MFLAIVKAKVPPLRLLLPPFAASPNRSVCCWEEGWLVGAVEIEPLGGIDTAQLIDSTKQQNGENPEKRRSEVHRGYTE